MNGRTEDKIKTERVLLKRIEEDNKYYLKGFYNYISSKYEHKTKELYIRYIIKCLSELNKNVTEITPDDINKYLCDLIYINKNGITDESSGTYRATIHSALNLYFRYLNEINIINNNPMDVVLRPKAKKNNQIVRVYLEPKEIQSLVNSIKKEKTKWAKRDLLIIMTFLYTGMRCTALTEINIDDINKETKTLTIIEKRNKKRVFELDDDYISLYDEVVAFDKELNPYNKDALFISSQLKRISPKTVTRLLQKNSINIEKNVTPHKLRRSYGRTLYESTGDLYLVQNALGHENIETTQLYVQGDKTEAAAKGMIAMKKKVKF